MVIQCDTQKKNPTEKRSGSVQIIEFSYVFPVVLTVVISLLYLSLVLFFYVYAFHLTEEAAEEALHAVSQSERVYWQLSGNSVDEGKKTEIQDRLKRKLKRMQVVPWVRFHASLEEQNRGSQIVATASCTFFGKEVYHVTARRDVCVPTAYAQDVDLLETAASQSDLWSRMKDRFSQYVKKDRTYEVF